MSGDYEEFIKHIYYEYIEQRLPLLHNLEFLHLNSKLPSYTWAMRAVRAIKNLAGTDEDVNRLFTQNMLRDTVGRVQDAVETSNRLVVDTEIADVIQDNFEEIVDGMSVEHFPKADFEVLRQGGSSDPHREIAATLYSLKARKEQFSRDGSQARFSQRLKEAEKRVHGIYELIPDEPNERQENPTAVKRAVFKGLGSLVEGGLLVITDVTLVAGLWGTSVSPDMTTVGAVLSMTTGIGKSLTGIGELRGE